MSPKSKERNEQRKEERREQILLAALKIISRRGLMSTKISDIASLAGLSHGLVYHYFASKEEIFLELIDRAIQSSSEALLALEKLPLEPLEKISAISEMVLGQIDKTEDSAFYFLLMIQATVSDANPEAAIERMRKPFVPFEAMLRIVEEGQKKGLIREGNAVDLVVLYWAAVQGLALYKISSGNFFTMPDPKLLTNLFTK